MARERLWRPLWEGRGRGAFPLFWTRGAALLRDIGALGDAARERRLPSWAPAAFSTIRSDRTWDLYSVFGPLQHIAIAGEVCLIGERGAAGPGIGQYPDVPNIGPCPAGHRGAIDGFSIAFLDVFGNEIRPSAGVGLISPTGTGFLTGLYRINFYVNSRLVDGPRPFAADVWGHSSPTPYYWLSADDKFTVTFSKRALTLAENPNHASYDGTNISDPVYAIACRIRGRWVPDDRSR